VAFTTALLASSSAQSAEFTALTLNTKHGGQAPWNTAAQIAEIVAEHPDVVLLQEANSSQLEEYVNGINKGLNSTAWRGEYAYHCDTGHQPECSSRTDEAVMILTRFPIADVERRLIWAEDQYFVARGVLRVELQLEDGSSVQVFAAHLPASSEAGTARTTWVNAFLPWARSFGGPTLLGGDFNDDASSPAVAAIRREYVDAWGTKGSGQGNTHSHDDKTYSSRIDYLFSAGGLQVRTAHVPQVTLSDHRPVVATYSTGANATQPSRRVTSSTPPSIEPTPLPATPTPSGSAAAAATSDGASAAGETVLLDDDFEAGIDPAKWQLNVFSGYQDMRVAVTAAAGAVRIVPLTRSEGISRYNGVSSAPVDLSHGGYARVQLVQGPIGAAAYAMFTAGTDAQHSYRIYQGGPADARMLLIEKRIDATRVPLATAPYDVSNDQYLTIRHDSRPQDGVDDVVFEASTAPSGITSTEIFREPWDPNIAASALVFELKAGTSAPEARPGVVIFDNFRAATISGR